MRFVLIVLLVALATVCAHQLQAEESKSSESSASATSTLSLLRLRARLGASQPPSPTLGRANSQNGKLKSQLSSQQKPNKLKSSSQSQKRTDLTSSSDSYQSEFSDEEPAADQVHTDAKNIYVCFDLDETLTTKRTTSQSLPTIFGKDSDSKTARLLMLSSYLKQLRDLSPLVRLYVLTFNSEKLAERALNERANDQEPVLATYFDKIVAWDSQKGLYNIFEDKLHSDNSARPRIKATYMEVMSQKFQANKDRMILIDDDNKNTAAAREMGFKEMTVPRDPAHPGIQEEQLKQLLIDVHKLVASGSF